MRFDVRPWDGSPGAARELVPLVDGVSLVELVAGFERAAGFDVPGAYAGLVLEHSRFGELTGYLAGAPESSYRAGQGGIALLGCDCGEVGCWPLQARVVVDSAHVTWLGFAQPFRPRRDYSGFGPFVFRREQYERAAREAAGHGPDTGPPALARA
ncbi:hypothetical protein [Pseudosporangium ferrugineum]|uniref:Uncharacterized protein n=1 Tax=Pseudosporangium ferrugineum TaxID=439699 RepID=A0A2T0RCR9_9ACTN|nr:hypothetical protein [Pseudosporangium ferrugineum]PRY18933.1 hypothetical protein CLV70_14112 [Pseudosporangium ferrugineum]